MDRCGAKRYYARGSRARRGAFRGNARVERSMDASGFVDILIFAMIALFLVFRLRSVLGRRTGHERPPENIPPENVPPENVPREVENAADPPARIPDAATPRGGEAPPPIPRAGTTTDPAASVANPLDAGLTELKIADPGFDEAVFLEGARGAFEFILDAFARGDKARLEPLLAGDVFDRFASEIDRREARKETLESALVSFVSADLVAATARGDRGGVTVRFVTDQINVTRNEEGEVVDGDETAVSRVVDIWSFDRNLPSDDPNWRLLQTRSEG